MIVLWKIMVYGFALHVNQAPFGSNKLWFEEVRYCGQSLIKVLSMELSKLHFSA